MRKLIHMKFFSSLLLLAMLTVMLHCAHDSAHAHAKQSEEVTGERVSHSEISTAQRSTCPHEQHNDYDGCDTCINCTCHAPLIIQPLQLSYNPIISNLGATDLFKHLPEVFLSKFIPPQNLV